MNLHNTYIFDEEDIFLKVILRKIKFFEFIFSSFIIFKSYSFSEKYALNMVVILTNKNKAQS